MKKPVIAIAYFNDPKIKGEVIFQELPDDKKVQIDIKLSGFKKNSIHAMHVHEAGDLSDSHCKGCCAHFNPYKKNHGGIHSKERHVGDLGNIKADNNGNVNMRITDNIIQLRNSKCNIIGRSLVIHEDEDDNGLGGHDDSLTTGHAGDRLACAVIGYSKKMFI
jgi:Cu-Zn family superoxide dismutase